ncbi:MAG: response regulator transcription factor [Flavobacteriales bacterium]|nr:response regulator transcription factor [Flavobacteriales bacterium]MBK7297730.1 response regulator transcription factor [Flavobacteriales bacterium]MBK9536394.1 response regulator transcription factor [Flavobacteriales bacterium]MBP9137299.1 response regulator transcription factor [Flavobacteriales bacterium]HQV50643.1 LytTR family DNA-binding domain-containing protein [Flavobacteriales bacterium]
MTELSAVIVDDEQHCRDALSGILERKHKNIKLLGMATNVPDGVALLGKVKPKILFLDIEMGNQTGFDLLQTIGPDRPHVIFTTAHEGFAVKAIRFSALDYLLKPVDPDELESAIAKVLQAERTPQTPDQFMALMKNLTQPKSAERRIALPVAEGLEMVDVDNITYCESDSNYTVVHQTDKKRLVISRTLKEFEDILDPERFIRVHHSYLINVKHITKYIRGEGGEVIMSDGTNVAVSRRKKQELMDSLARL